MNSVPDYDLFVAYLVVWRGISPCYNLPKYARIALYFTYVVETSKMCLHDCYWNWNVKHFVYTDTINNSDALWSMRENRLLSILMMLGYWKPYETDIIHWSGLHWTKQEHVFDSTNSVGCLQRHRYEFQYIMICIKNCFHNMPMVFNEFEHKEIHTDRWGWLKNVFWKQNC